jgi:hypothetical protein
VTTATGLRKRRTHLFVQVPSETIRDKRLSFRARGLLAYLLDMPEGWDVKSEHLSTQGKEGREAIRTALHELGEHGYYRLERRQLLNGKFGMGTSISEEPVEQWAIDYAEYDGKAVPCHQQTDGSFKVRHKDGSLTEDGFEEAVDPNQGPEDDGPPSGETGDGFSGPGFPGSGSPDAGAPGSGNLGALREKETGDTDGSSSSAADAADVEKPDEPVDEKNDRDDVKRVCEHLVEKIVANGSKRPTITKRWRDAARLLMDTDGRTEHQVHNMIDWCQADEFWRANILSMPTLREKYDQMRLRALKETQEAATPKRGEFDWDGAMERARDIDASLAARATGVTR